MKLRLFVFIIIIMISGQSWGQGSQNNHSALPEIAKDENELLKKIKTQKNEEPFDSFVCRNNNDFKFYLDSINKEYAEFLAKNWKPAYYGGIHYSKEDKEKRPATEEWENENIVVKGRVVDFKAEKRPQPKPPYDILENDKTSTWNTFNFYGTPMKVRWGDAGKFKFQSISNQELSKAYKHFSSNKYNNLLYDCLKLRENYYLCDWAYYKMLQTLSETIFGKDRRNEAVFLQGVLYEQSGYYMRFARDKQRNQLYLLCKIDGDVHDYQIQKDEDTREEYYLFEKDRKDVEFCPNAYQGEQEMSMEIPELPKLEKKLSDERVVYDRNLRFRIPIKINENLIHFFNDYPSSFNKNDTSNTPQWKYFANIPASQEINDIYKILKSEIRGDTIAAVNTILSWVCPHYYALDNRPKPTDGQIGFPYAHDNDRWKHDRTFSADETLYYPDSDCEDHAILFSRIVRDLLNLDVVLVWYQGHLAAAVHFNSGGDGVKVKDDNEKLYTICDPSSYHGRVGLIEREYENAKPKIIKLKK